MKIALHMGTLRGLGSAQVGMGVLEELVRQGAEHQFRAWVPTAWRLEERSLELGDTELHPVQPGISHKLWCENVSMRTTLRRWRADRLFSLTDTSMPFASCPHLLMIHQAHLVYEPGDWGFDPPPALRLRMALMTSYLRQTLRSVRCVTVQSADMKRRLCARFGLNEAQVLVVPSALPSPPAAQELTEAPERDEMTLLCVSGPAPHKNLVVLLDMLSALEPRHASARLLLTVDGKANPGLVEAARRRGVLDRVDFLGACEPDRIRRLSQTATIALQPSLLESFGLSYYESMAAGLPLVVSDRPFAREACGDAALYADGASGASFAERVEQLLDAPSDARDLAERGIARIETWGWDWARVAARYLEILEGLDQGPSRI